MHTFLFADLAGFTALTEAHGDERAADLVGSFCASVRVLLPRYGAEQVKAIGDGLMLRVQRAGDAVALGLRLTQELGGQHAFPSVRAGLNTGPAVGRDGDWFGASVNLAAQVADAAAAGELLLTDATRAAAEGELARQCLAGPWRLELKNVSKPVDVWAIDSLGPVKTGGRLPVDPVCRMLVDPSRAAAVRRYLGTQYYFCSPACTAAFDRDPARVASRSSTPFTPGRGTTSRTESRKAQARGSGRCGRGGGPPGA